MDDLWQFGPQKGATGKDAAADHRITSVAPLADQPLGNGRWIIPNIDEVATWAAQIIVVDESIMTERQRSRYCFHQPGQIVGCAGAAQCIDNGAGQREGRQTSGQGPVEDHAITSFCSAKRRSHHQTALIRPKSVPRTDGGAKSAHYIWPLRLLNAVSAFARTRPSTFNPPTRSQTVTRSPPSRKRAASSPVGSPSL